VKALCADGELFYGAPEAATFAPEDCRLPVASTLMVSALQRGSWKPGVAVRRAVERVGLCLRG